MVEFTGRCLCLLLLLVIIETKGESKPYITDQRAINSNYERGSDANPQRYDRRKVIGYTVATSNTFDITREVKFGICRSLFFKHGNTGVKKIGDTGKEVSKVGGKFFEKTENGGSKDKKQYDSSRNRDRKSIIVSRFPRSIENLFVRETLYRHVAVAKFAAKRNRHNSSRYTAESESPRQGDFYGFTSNVRGRYGEFSPQRDMVNDEFIGNLFSNDRGYRIHNTNNNYDAANRGTLYKDYYKLRGQPGGLGMYGRYGEGFTFRNNNILNKAVEVDQPTPINYAIRDESDVHDRPFGGEVNNQRSANSHRRSEVSGGRYGGTRGGTSIFII